MLTPDFHPFPVLQTPRLVLRRMEKKDAPALYEMRRDKTMMQYIPRPVATCIEDVYGWMEMLQNGVNNNDSIIWGIALPTDDTLVGFIGFVRMKKEHYRAEVGYMLAKEQHGKGMISEALREVVRYGFEEMKLHSIEAVIAPANIASEKILQKAGFVLEGKFKENEFYNGKFLDTTVYSLLTPLK